jgi:cysteine desulfurase / selenocysteine lyase
VNTKTEILSKEINFDVMKIREDFPILKTLVHGKPLCYLDNGATTQKPQLVIDTLNEYYTSINSNIHRAVHTLGEKATAAFEDARIKVKNFINAESEKEIIFTRGTTESINLVANSFGRSNLNEGDEILITGMEHHSNIVPWQLIAAEKNAVLKVVPVTDSGELNINDFEKLITDRTKIIAVVHVSNTLGTINPVEKIIALAHKHGVPVLLDAAQAVSHFPVDVQKLDCDFFAFSGHKLYGPTGIGVLYGKEKLLEQMPPFMGGGDMISSVTFNKTTYNDLPFKFEAGTSNIADAIGLGAAIDYIKSVGFESISKYEKYVFDYVTNELMNIEGLKIIGTAPEKTSVISFVLDNVHPHDVGTFLDYEGIAVRTGHHCTQPLMDRFCIPATSRASFSMYNTIEEADILVRGIKKVIEAFI